MTSDKNQLLPDVKSGKQKTILLLLGAVALASVFLLPSLVSGPWLIDTTLEGPVVPDTSPDYVAPSTAAEKTKYRQDSQTVLAQIIQLRDLLQEQSVNVWAPVDFQLGLENVVRGDELYSYGEYRQALESYEKTLETFTELKQIGQDKLEASLESGFAAIESLNGVIATETSSLAIAIAPQDPRALELVKRTASLPELTIQLETGDQARAEGKLSSAQTAYQQAVNLDPMHQRATDSLSGIKSEIVESNFRQHMSRAYAALDNVDYDAAIEAFAQAGTVHPGHPAITQGLAQIENQRSQTAVSQQIVTASSLESEEEWAKAIEVYESLLQQDPTLTEAKVKLIPVRVRADLDQRLERLSEDPLKLSQQSNYRQAQVALNDARGITNPGERLKGQIEYLETLLMRAVTSVDVVFQSDNITTVTLFRVAQLGQFQQTSMTLKPGRYIVAGTRQGYRDVRVEFSVTGEPLDGPIVISCDEPI